MSLIFVRTVERFMQEMGLFPKKEGKIFIAVSGGVDSLALLHTLSSIFRRRATTANVSVLHVNHNTRPETAEEALLVSRHARALGFSVIIHTLAPDLLRDGGNFEMRARRERYHFFHSHINAEAGDRLYMGHHLDDSFEWSLLQSFKSGSLKGSLGIPVKNGVIVRPFLCVTKNQILAEGQKQKIDFMEDSSNFDTRFERNFIRQQLISSIKKRFPNYLKHYAYRSNSYAKQLGCFAGEGDTRNKTSSYFLDALGTVVFSRASYDSFQKDEEIILKTIEQLSSQKRGVLRTQLTKMIRAEASGDRIGPLTFSGGVLGWMAPSQLGFMKKSSVAKYLEQDELLVQKLKAGEIDKMEGGKLFPFLVISLQHPKRVLPSLKKIHPLFPKTTAYLLQNGGWFHFSMSLEKSLTKKGMKESSLPSLFRV